MLYSHTDIREAEVFLSYLSTATGSHTWHGTYGHML